MTKPFRTSVSSSLKLIHTFDFQSCGEWDSGHNLFKIPRIMLETWLVAKKYVTYLSFSSLSFLYCIKYHGNLGKGCEKNCEVFLRMFSSISFTSLFLRLWDHKHGMTTVGIYQPALSGTQRLGASKWTQWFHSARLTAVRWDVQVEKVLCLPWAEGILMLAIKTQV